MQYGIEVDTYKRIVPQKTKKKNKVEINILTNVFYIVAGILISRVVIPITNEISLAPFGLAFYWAIANVRRDSKNILIFSSVVLGYLSIFNKDISMLIYLLSATIILLYSNIKSEMKQGIQISTVIITLLVGFLIYGIMFTDLQLSELIFYSSIRSISVVPLFFIFKYATTVSGNIKSNYVFTMEEMISGCLLLSFIVVGVGNFTVLNVNIQTILCLLIVLCSSYVMGAGTGAAFGVCVGFISGLTGSDMIMSVSVYSVCGLMSGVFKESGKLFASLAFILAFLIISMYSETISIYSSIEVVISIMLFVIVPSKIFVNMSKELNKEERVDSVQGIQLIGMKKEFEQRVYSLKNVLNSVSTSISSLTENDKLLLKNKETALVENLADRVCESCNKKDKCWKSDLHLTYSLFTDTISNFELGNEVLPKELEKRCKNKYRLIRDVKDIISIQQAKEMAKNRLTEGRLLIANHINSMSLKLDEMFTEFEASSDDCLNIDKVLRKRAIRKGVRFENLYSYIDGNGRLRVKVTLMKGDDEKYCLSKILPMINNLVKVPLSISEKDSYVDEKTGMWVGVIEETPKFLVKSYTSTEIKQSEQYSGDNHYHGEDKNGKYLTIVSDGMGSGAGAGLESKVCIDLVRKYLEAGYSLETAIDVVNSIMSMKFNEDEKFATLDFNMIDLYTGDISFVKFGGVISFVKRGEFVEIIKSDTLPIGILDNLDVNKIKSNVKDGDVVVTITDGVIDVDKENVGGYLWLKEYLESYEDSIEMLSDNIVGKAKELSGDKIYDDMTVVVSKVYSVY